jgi:predicted nucleic acid-binding protein
VRTYFFDTSALVKLLVDEPGSKTVQKIKGFAGHGGSLETSRMALAEAATVLKRKWLEELKAAKTAPERVTAYERYRKRIYRLYVEIPMDFKLHDDLVDAGFDEVWAVISEIWPTAAGQVDAVDVMHAGVFAAPLLATAAGNSKPFMVSADAGLNAYCRSKGIEVIDPIAEEPNI